MLFLGGEPTGRSKWGDSCQIFLNIVLIPTPRHSGGGGENSWNYRRNHMESEDRAANSKIKHNMVIFDFKGGRSMDHIGKVKKIHVGWFLARFGLCMARLGCLFWNFLKCSLTSIKFP